MLSGSNYRFCLQWGSDTSEKIMVGQLLNRLGNKKSEFVVNALVEYVHAHPEVVSPDSIIHINVHPTQSDEQLQDMVKKLAKATVEEFMAGMTLVPSAMKEAELPAGPSQDEISEMLNNLNLLR